MLLHCDLVLVEQGARLVMPFVDLGLVPEAASSLIVPQLAGRRAAARYLLLGEPMGAEEALAARIASHVVERGKLGETLDKIVAALLAKPKDALRQTQDLLRQVSSDEILERMNSKMIISQNDWRPKRSSKRSRPFLRRVRRRADQVAIHTRFERLTLIIGPGSSNRLVCCE